MPGDALSRVITLPRVPRAAGAARYWVRETLTRWRLADAAGCAEQVASELVTNAIQHACDDSPVVVLLMHAAGALRMEVRDRDPLHLPVRRHAGPLDAGGRGLAVVADLSDRWGVRVTGAGKAVWCVLAVSPRIPRLLAAARHEGGDTS